MCKESLREGKLNHAAATFHLLAQQGVRRRAARPLNNDDNNNNNNNNNNDDNINNSKNDDNPAARAPRRARVCVCMSARVKTGTRDQRVPSLLSCRQS